MIITILAFYFISNSVFATCGVCCKEAGGDPELRISKEVMEDVLALKSGCYKALVSLTHKRESKAVERILFCAKFHGGEEIGSDAPRFIKCVKKSKIL